MNSMKICFIAPRIHTNQNGWIDVLNKHGHQVAYIILSDHSETIKTKSVTTYSLDSTSVPLFIRIIIYFYYVLRGKHARQSPNRIPDYGQLKNYIREINPDIVIVRDVLLPLSLLSFWICKKQKIRATHYSQQPLEDNERLMVRFLKKIGLVPKHRITPVKKNPDLEYNKKTNTYYVPLITTTPAGIIDREYCPNQIPRLLFIGKFSLARKNHLLLLKVVKMLKSEYEFTMTMIGRYKSGKDRYTKKVTSYLEEHKLKDIVTIKYNVPFNEMREIYKSHDILVLPSVDEPYSISVLEAMSHGLPVIHTDTSGAQYLIRHSGTGKVIKSNDAQVLESSLAGYLQDTMRIKQEGVQAHTYVRDNFSADEFYRLFSKALNI